MLVSEYDKMGNIKKIKRKGLATKWGIQGQYPQEYIDDLELEYDGNRLIRGTNNAEPPSYKDAMYFQDAVYGDEEYAYDANGNMIMDLNKQVERIWYDTQNHPFRIQQKRVFGWGVAGKPQSFTREVISYTYDAAGNKLQTRYETEHGQSMPGRIAYPPVEHTTITLKSKVDYCGNFIYENDTLAKVINTEGYTSFAGSGRKSHYYLKDHQGNIRVVIDQAGNAEQVNHYYPFGGLFGRSTNGEVQPWKYGGKELERMHGLDLYDFIARMQDPTTGRFISIDPMCEKYYSISPYVYCMNNPVRYVDPNGMDIYLYGSLSNLAFEQLQSGARGIDLTMDETGALCYSLNKKRMNDYARTLIGMIDNCSITLNINATDKNTLANGDYMVGGAFMGNNVSKDSEGNVSVSAFQTVNPSVLGAVDDFTYTSGKMMMHEVSEAYQGGIISKEKGISSPRYGLPGSAYDEAHRKATPQTNVYEIMYDNYDMKTKNLKDAVRSEFYIENFKGEKKIIQIQKHRNE